LNLTDAMARWLFALAVVCALPIAAVSGGSPPLPALALQVALDRAGFSPGQIDGRNGRFTSRARDAFLEARKGPIEPSADPLTQYTITEADAAGPFVEQIPSEIEEQAKLQTLVYTSVVEALAERFHASPTLLKELNTGATFTAGATISVPAVDPFMLPTRQGERPKSSGNNGARTASIELSRETQAIVVRDASGGVLFYAPVTVGSEQDPLPVGDWKVTGVFDLPVFNYNPDLFWDADPSHAKATIPAGPNNPVGVVWIGIDKEHFGFHGTPEPSQIGRTESHGCVRLTNWDAEKLASLVTEGTPVRLR
jgi:lipoprotein-anchoring transpeptidase ErfK/SrfK